MPYSAPVKPVVQLALDFLNADQALRAAEEAVPAGIAWLEAGTPLIKSAGLDVVRRLRAAHPKVCLIADMKVMDAGRTEVEAAKKAGADVVMVLGAATDATIRECVETGKHLGVAIGGDLLGVAAPAERARQLEAMGVNLVSVHTPIDQQMQGINGFATLTEVVKAVRIPVACAGGLSPATAPKAVAAGARIIICGGAITKAPDNRAAALAMIEAVANGKAPAGDGLYQRKGLDEIRTVLNRVSTPNLSDAMHRGGALRGLTNHNPTKRLCGPAFTVQCAPGDWSKSVQAIDAATPGDVLVIDASDQYPALWGGLASLSAVSRKLGGVVISGACRDLADIHASGLPLWSSKVCPDAGEPRGIGVFGIPVTIGGLHLRPGDWLVGDEDGLVVIPADHVVEIANRAQDVMEREQRVAAEIKAGRTLAQIAELKKWEQA
jgi:3-hexulose-6-phosphate synthase/6-phospho-3-hexuloisomerase